jgi:Tfp pilus assembly protein PilN
MKAVNLIPADQRRNSSVSGRSGGVVYVLMATLAGLVLLAGLYGLTAKSIDGKTTQIADATARANAADATAKSLAGYTDFSAARTQRTAAIKALADARVDWAHILSEVARTLPANSRLTTLHGSTAGTAGTAGGATVTASPATTSAGSSPAPAIDLGGCTTSQTAVSTLMADLRRIDGVSDVTLSSSAKQSRTGAATSAGSTSASTSAGCGTNDTTFAMKLTFKAPVAGATTAGQSATTAGSTK